MTAQHRVIPDDFAGITSQALLNLALSGYYIIGPDGDQFSENLLRNADEINRDYQRSLDKVRRRTATTRHRPRTRPAEAHG